MLIALIIVGVVLVLLVILAVAPFGDSGVSRAKDTLWSGASANPKLRYDPEARFNRPPDGR